MPEISISLRKNYFTDSSHGFSFPKQQTELQYEIGEKMLLVV